MGLREQYQKIVDKKRAEIDGLRLQIVAAESYLTAMQDAIKLLPREPNGDAPILVELRPGSKLAKAQDYLRVMCKSMRVDDILVALGEPVTQQNRVALSGSLGNYAKQGKVFQKTGKNEFGLIEFAQNEEPESDEPEEDGAGGEGNSGGSSSPAGFDQRPSSGPDDYAQQAEISDDDIPF
jgi:hypothetical protein